MAITITEVQRLVTSTNATSYAFSAYTPTINTLQVIFVYAPGTITGPWGITDSGTLYLGWSRSSTTTFSSISSPTDAFMMFKGWQGDSPVSMTPSFTCTADGATGLLAVWYEIAGVNTEDGPMDSESPIPGGNAVAALTWIGTLDGFTPPYVSDGSANPVVYAGCYYAGDRNVPMNPNNAYMIAIAAPRNPAAYTAPSGWTELVDVGIAGPAAGLWIGQRIGGESGESVTVTGTSTAWVAHYIEFCAPGEYPYIEPRTSNVCEMGLFGV